MPEILVINDFISRIKEETIFLLDVRSEKEFAHSHIPGAVNIPLLNNEHRHLVGIEYKQNGREAAVSLGFKLVGPLFHEFIEKVNSLRDKKDIMLYCWRGGMRSSIMAWILSMAGIKVSTLKGGYKTFRGFILSQFKEEKNVIVLGGHTGSGKTEILKLLFQKGEQVIDLEEIANHRGSSFGQLGLPPQPSNEQFENILGLKWHESDPERTLWLEAESRSIGNIKIHDFLFNQLQSASIIEVLCSLEKRKENILKVYGEFPVEELVTCTTRLEKRLGNLKMKQAVAALRSSNLDEWLEIMLHYYDGYYSYSMEERKSIARIEYKWNEKMCLEDNAEEIRKLSLMVKEKRN